MGVDGETYHFVYTERMALAVSLAECRSRAHCRLHFRIFIFGIGGGNYG
jgi:hypothetical protein